MNRNIERLVIGGGALVLGLLAGWMMRGVATYNTASESSTVYNDWRMFCPQAQIENVDLRNIGRRCRSDAQGHGGAHLDRQGFPATRKIPMPVIAYTLPPNVLLPNGVGVQVGKEPVKTVWYRSCNQQELRRDHAAGRCDDQRHAGRHRHKISFIGAQPQRQGADADRSITASRQPAAPMNAATASAIPWFWRLWS